MIRLSWRPLIALVLTTALFSSPSGAGWEIGDMAEIMDTSVRLRESAGSSDGMGGMLLMAIDQGGSPYRISVTRVDHTGTEVWGDNGFWLPAIVGDTPSVILPTAVANDGQGGGYFAYHAENGGDDYLKVAYVNATGTWLWTTTIDNLGFSGSKPDAAVQLVTTSAGNVIVIFTRFTGGPIHYSASLDQTGTILWHGPVNDSWGWDSYAKVTSDGLGGALVAYWRDDVIDEVRVQRLNESNCARVWGTDGRVVYTGSMPHRIEVVSDGAGGGYVVRSYYAAAYAKHFNASGLTTWPSEVTVQDTQNTTTWAQSTHPRLCEDGVGGFILFHGYDTLFAQRVDVNGTRLWGTGTTVTTLAHIGTPRTISPDGSGGAIVTFENDWLIDGGPETCQQVNGARIDPFGTVLWTDYLDWCKFNTPPSGPDIFEEPHNQIGFGDGSGGGIFAWLLDDLDGYGDELMWGKGVDAAGGEPTARGTYLHPDNAQPGDTGPYLILGDYLDLNLGYTLEKEDGSASQALSPTDFHSYQMVGGTTTLTGLTPGAYHLNIDDGGTSVHTFEWALGVGYPLTCDTEYTILGVERAVDLAGSQRQATWVDGGFLHAFWVEYTPFSPHYRINWMTRDGGWREQASPYSSDAPLSAPTVTSDSMNRLHLAFVEELDATHDQLHYMQLGEEADVLLSRVFDPGEVIRNPVIAWTQDNLAHVVMERGASPGNDLLHVIHNGSSFSAGVNPTTHGSPRTPDLAAMGTSLELVWASDSPVPGIQMIEQATYYGGMWHPARVVSFGLVMTSPSVAFDGNDQTLYAWIIDNELINGIPPLVHTQLRVGEELFDVRARPGWPRHHSVSVASPFAGKFVMFTSESEGGPVIRVVGREGDGKVFFPRLQVNAGTDIQHPRFAIQLGGNALNAYWQSFSSPTEPVTGANCELRATAVLPPDMITIDSRLIGRPNPFNPGTEFHFELTRESYVVLEVFDVRGHLVRTLFRGELDRGPQAIPWDGRDDRRAELASGTYIARLEHDDGSVAVVKVALLK